MSDGNDEICVQYYMYMYMCVHLCVCIYNNMLRMCTTVQKVCTLYTCTYTLYNVHVHCIPLGAIKLEHSKS